MSVSTPTRPEKPLRQSADTLAPLGSVLQEQDTRRVDLAQRLHRDVAGGLVACATMSEMIRQELRNGGGNDALTGMLTSLESALRQTIQVVRELTGEQLPSVLKTFGVAGALQQIADDAGTRIELTLSGAEPSLPLSQRLCLHQILQALIQRIRQRGTASSIEVICMFEPSRMEVLIEHDGMDVMHALSDDDATLAAIKGRISLLGGRLLLSRHSHDGPRRVRLVVPFPLTTGEIPPPTTHPVQPT
jgi:signal transduction histidine kinase